MTKFWIKRACQNAGISLEGRKMVTIKDSDSEEAVRQFESNYLLDKRKTEFEYTEMNHKYPFQRK